MMDTLKNLWFQDTKGDTIYINDTAVRIRAGILLSIPIFMSFSLYEAVFVSHWIVDGNTATDLGDTDWDENIIYAVEAVRRVYDYSWQSLVLVYAFFEMLASMFVTTSRLSPTILISSFLARGKPQVWKPLVPKRFAWTMGAIFIALCWIFFNPEIFASWVNVIFGAETLSTTENYMSPLIPLTLVWICFAFMWLETTLGFCAGCKIHAFLVYIGVLKEDCYSCNNIDWDEIAAKNKARSSLDNP